MDNVQLDGGVVKQVPVVPPTVRVLNGKLMPMPTGDKHKDMKRHVPDIDSVPKVHAVKLNYTNKDTGERTSKQVTLPPHVQPEKLGAHTPEELEDLSSQIQPGDKTDAISNEGQGRRQVNPASDGGKAGQGKAGGKEPDGKDSPSGGQGPDKGK